jgi:hypothetical protein
MSRSLGKARAYILDRQLGKRLEQILHACLGKMGQDALDRNPSTFNDWFPRHDLRIKADTIAVIVCHMPTS